MLFICGNNKQALYISDNLKKQIILGEFKNLIFLEYLESWQRQRNLLMPEKNPRHMDQSGIAFWPIRGAPGSSGGRVQTSQRIAAHAQSEGHRRMP
jgi:hypothetical protein